MGTVSVTETVWLPRTLAMVISSSGVGVLVGSVSSVKLGLSVPPLPTSTLVVKSKSSGAVVGSVTFFTVMLPQFEILIESAIGARTVSL